jgi:hypothetical protein
VFEWAKPGDLSTLQVEWYVPGQRELAAANSLLKKFLQPNLEALVR